MASVAARKRAATKQAKARDQGKPTASAVGQGEATANAARCATANDVSNNNTAPATAAANKKAEQARKKAEKEAATKARKEEQARKKAEKEAAAAARKAATDAKRAEAARKKAEKEAAAAARKAATDAKRAEAARKKIEKEQEKARKKAEREEAKRKKDEEEAKKKAAAASTVKPKQWQHSKARKMMKADIQDGTITLEAYHERDNPDGTKVEDAYELRPEFKHYPFDKFIEYLDSMRQSIKSDQSRAARDAQAVANFRSYYPKPTHNHRGEPRWEGSAAQAQLQKDIDNDVHLKKTPQEMRRETPEYQKYELRTIINHIDQELRRRKFYVYLEDKNAKKKKELGK